MSSDASKDFGYGRRITTDEYNSRVFAAHRNPSLSEGSADREEFDAMIDCRLGEGFPADRRAALHAARAAVRRKLPWIIFLGLVKKGHDPSSQFPAQMIKAFSEVLTPEEARHFLDLEDVGL